MTRLSPPLLVAIAFVVLAACSPAAAPSPTSPPDDGVSSDATDVPDATDPGDGGDAADAVLVIDTQAIADGPGISVEDAVRSNFAEGVLVNGAVFIAPDGTALLCDAILESFPPQCGGTRLRVEGLTPEMLPNLQEEGDVRWAEGVQLFGTIERP
jgi:hypothetical protein